MSDAPMGFSLGSDSFLQTVFGAVGGTTYYCQEIVIIFAVMTEPTATLMHATVKCNYSYSPVVPPFTVAFLFL